MLEFLNPCNARWAHRAIEGPHPGGVDMRVVQLLTYLEIPMGNFGNTIESGAGGPQRHCFHVMHGALVLSFRKFGWMQVNGDPEACWWFFRHQQGSLNSVS